MSSQEEALALYGVLSCIWNFFLLLLP